MVEAEVVQGSKINECKSFIVWILTSKSFALEILHGLFCEPRAQQDFQSVTGGILRKQGLRPCARLRIQCLAELLTSRIPQHACRLPPSRCAVWLSEMRATIRWRQWELS